MTLIRRSALLGYSLRGPRWDDAQHHAEMVLSDNRYRITRDDISTGTTVCGRSERARATGKHYAEINRSHATMAVGIVNASFPHLSTGVFPGSTLDGFGVAADGNWYLNNVLQSAVAPTSGVLCLAIDLTAELFWAAGPTGDWNGSGAANPATATGGISFAGANAGPWYFAVAINQSTLNAYAESVEILSRPVPAGFGRWGR